MPILFDSHLFDSSTDSHTLSACLPACLSSLSLAHFKCFVRIVFVVVSFCLLSQLNKQHLLPSAFCLFSSPPTDSTIAPLLHLSHSPWHLWSRCGFMSCLHVLRSFNCFYFDFQFIFVFVFSLFLQLFAFVFVFVPCLRILVRVSSQFQLSLPCFNKPNKSCFKSYSCFSQCWKVFKFSALYYFRFIILIATNFVTFFWFKSSFYSLDRFANIFYIVFNHIAQCWKA